MIGNSLFTLETLVCFHFLAQLRTI